MTDDELLASAFRKILNPGRQDEVFYGYLYLSGPDDPDQHLVLDDTYTKRDGLTPEEFDAIRRVIGE